MQMILPFFARDSQYVSQKDPQVNEIFEKFSSLRMNSLFNFYVGGWGVGGGLNLKSHCFTTDFTSVSCNSATTKGKG